jgi:hypothetical protein
MQSHCLAVALKSARFLVDLMHFVAKHCGSAAMGAFHSDLQQNAVGQQKIQVEPTLRDRDWALLMRLRPRLFSNMRCACSIVSCTPLIIHINAAA